MPDPLIRHLKKYVPIDPSDEAEIAGFFQELSLSKKEDLLREGQTCRHCYFVRKGCLRMFFINAKGVEQTIHFAIENWWITDYAAFEQQQLSAFSIQAVEPSDVLAIDRHAQDELLRRFPQVEQYFRKIFQRAYAAAQMRTRYLYDFSREEFYDHFAAHFPEFIQRIPQYLLASYLNMTPEYLSEIRGRKRS